MKPIYEDIQEIAVKERKQRFMREIKGHYTEDEFNAIISKTRLSPRVSIALKLFMVDGRSYAEISGISKQQIYNAIFRLQKRGLI